MFTNETVLASLPPAQRSGIKNYGEEIWDAMCWLGAKGEPFRRSALIETFIRGDKTGLNPKTAAVYVDAFMRYARNAADDFSGPASRLTQVRQGLWRLADNPEK